MSKIKSKVKIISADIGLTGFISIVVVEDRKFKVLNSFKIEVEDKIKNLISNNKESKAVIKKQIDFVSNSENIADHIEKDDIEIVGLYENITNRPTNSAVSMMSLADSACCFRCIYECLEIENYQVQPSVWKRHFNISKDKNESKELFKSLINKKIGFYNDLDLSKIKNHNQIESILIAYYYAEIKNLI